MDTRHACSRSLNTGKVITCSGACGLVLHHICAGLTKVQYSAWTAAVGLYWFCDSCRLNFNPAAHDRDKTIMKALRELLIRTDSMDTRLSNYGDNLRTINITLNSTQQFKPANQFIDQTTFHHTIDQLSFDDTTDPINRSRSCDETSFFEVLDEVNSTLANQPNRLVVGNRRVQILQNQHSSTTAQATVSTPAAFIPPPNVSRISNLLPASQDGTDSNKPYTANVSQPSSDITTPSDNANESSLRLSTRSLSVAKFGLTTDDAVAFYVSPFIPDQKEDDVKQHIHDIANVASSPVKVVILVPRGKSLEDLSFISFKVIVNMALSKAVGDPSNWPEGVTVLLHLARTSHNVNQERSTSMPPIINSIQH